MTDASGFRLVRSAKVGTTHVVYGLDAAADGNAADDDRNHVVRIRDAIGTVIAEDVTVDQTEIGARAFVVELPADAKGPFTAELFDFDRTWYDAQDEPTTFVRPGAPVLDTQVANDAVLIE